MIANEFVNFEASAEKNSDFAAWKGLIAKNNPTGFYFTPSGSEGGVGGGPVSQAPFNTFNAVFNADLGVKSNGDKTLTMNTNVGHYKARTMTQEVKSATSFKIRLQLTSGTVNLGGCGFLFTSNPTLDVNTIANNDLLDYFAVAGAQPVGTDVGNVTLAPASLSLAAGDFVDLERISPTQITIKYSTSMVTQVYSLPGSSYYFGMFHNNANFTTGPVVWTLI